MKQFVMTQLVFFSNNFQFCAFVTLSGLNYLGTGILSKIYCPGLQTNCVKFRNYINFFGFLHLNKIKALFSHTFSE